MGFDAFNHRIMDDFLKNPKKYWVTRKLEPIAIVDMTDNHIQRCISLIESKDGWRREYLVPLKKELAKRNGTIGDLVYGD